MTASEIVGRIEKGWHELDGLARGLDEEGLSLPRSPDGWAIKDHLVHVAAWEQWLLALFEGRDKLAAMGAEGAGKQIDDVNQAVYEHHRDDGVHDALEYFRGSHARLMELLRKQSTDDFERPYKTFFSAGDESDEQPVSVAVAANTYDHYTEHVTWMREQLSGPQRR